MLDDKALLLRLVPPSYITDPFRLRAPAYQLILSMVYHSTYPDCSMLNTEYV